VQPLDLNLTKTLVGKNQNIDLSKNIILTADLETITLSVDNNFIRQIESKKNITKLNLKQKKIMKKKKNLINLVLIFIIILLKDLLF